MDIFNWIYSGKVVQTPLKCWKQVTLNYDIDKKDVHICHSADHVEKGVQKSDHIFKKIKKERACVIQRDLVLRFYCFMI